MPRYMILARFTDQTAMSFAALVSEQPPGKPAAKLLQALQDLAKEGELNGKLEQLFFTAGEPDMVLVLTMPEQKQAVAYAFAVTRKLGVRTTTLPAFDPSEMEDVFHLAPKVGGP